MGTATGDGRGALTGHMVRAERALREHLGVVDVVWEVADARCPGASRNPRLRRLCAGKPAVLVLSKADLAEEDVTRRWIARLRAEQVTVAIDLRSGDEIMNVLWSATRSALEPARTGQRPHETCRAMVVGIPNTGKSTLLNRATGGRHAAVGAAPGVTRGPQWVRLPQGGQVLDLPGVMAPRLSGWAVIWRLWAIGALGAQAVDAETAGGSLCEWIQTRHPRTLEGRYGIAEREMRDGSAGLAAIAVRRGLLSAGGVPDGNRAAAALLADFRRGLLGAVTLEVPADPIREGDGSTERGEAARP